MSIRDSMSIKHWHRYPAQGWVAGVCQGLGEYFGWNVKLLRVLFVVGFFASGIFPVAFGYAVLWYLMDEADSLHSAPSKGYTPSYAASTRSSPAPASTAPASPSDLKARFARMEDRLRGMEECVASRDFELRRELKKLEG